MNSYSKRRQEISSTVSDKNLFLPKLYHFVLLKNGKKEINSFFFFFSNVRITEMTKFNLKKNISKVYLGDLLKLISNFTEQRTSAVGVSSLV